MLFARSLVQQVPQPRFGQPTIVQSQSFGLDLGIKAEEAEIGRNGGSGGAAEPGESRLGVGLAGVEEGLIIEGLPERIAVFLDLQAYRSALTTNLDVRGASPNPLKYLKLIPETYWFSESGLWATNLRGAIMAPLSYVPQRLTSVTTLSTSLVFGPHLIGKTLQG